jgi:hypothetical protein
MTTIPDGQSCPIVAIQIMDLFYKIHSLYFLSTLITFSIYLVLVSPLVLALWRELRASDFDVGMMLRGKLFRKFAILILVTNLIALLIFGAYAYLTQDKDALIEQVQMMSLQGVQAPCAKN